MNILNSMSGDHIFVIGITLITFVVFLVSVFQIMKVLRKAAGIREGFAFFGSIIFSM